MSKLAFSMILLLTLATGAAHFTGAAETDKAPTPARKSGTTTRDFPLNVCLVHEMGYIPELASWKREKIDNAPDHVKHVTAQWKKLAPSLEGVITAPLARRLSRWSKKQMANYKTVSPLANVKFTVVRANVQQRKIVFEGTVDTLPTHSPIVTRWLRVYVLYDTVGKTIVRTTVTIRGQVLE